MAKRQEMAYQVTVPSSSRWHPAGGDSLWWRHYSEDSEPHLYRDCPPNRNACRMTPCCDLYNLHASQCTFRLPNCCRANATCENEGATGERGECKCARVAVFDLDGTLITTRSGKKFPKNSHDWKLLHDTHVAAHLRRLHDEGYLLFILSNQLGVTIGHVTLFDMTSKVDEIQRTLQVPLTCCLCCCDDLYRKPRPTGAALLFQELLPRVLGATQSNAGGNGCSSKTPVGLDSGERKYPRVFFVGDAAGRPGDHSSADIRFALNAGMHFFTPEEFFLCQAAPPLPLLLRRQQLDSKACTPGVEPKAQEQMLLGKVGKLQRRGQTKTASAGVPLDPSELLKRVASFGSCEAPNAKLEAEDTQQGEQPGQELIVLVGAPGSGKSTVVKRLFPNHAVVRQDDLKSKSKCVELCQRLLREGKSVVIDRQNTTRQERQQFIDIARQHAPGCTARCVALLWPKELCLHLGRFRTLATILRSRRPLVPAEGKTENASLSDTRYRLEKVPKIVVDKFYAHLELPSVDEGFAGVQVFQDISKDFLLYDDFCSGDERSLFGSFLD